MWNDILDAIRESGVETVEGDLYEVESQVDSWVFDLSNEDENWQ